MVKDLKKWLDSVYQEKKHTACLELPILNILVSSQENDGWVSRKYLVESLSAYGPFQRGALSFDHLWSQRFRKGDEAHILSALVEHDGKNVGDKKTKYKIKDEIKDELKEFLNTYEKDIKILINIRLDYLKSKEKSGIYNTLKPARTKTQTLNQILYGPPGTGKTYHTINQSLEIILEREPNDELKAILGKLRPTQEERTKIRKAFDFYKRNKQIEYVTFHQSYGYEEFIEGIRAIPAGDFGNKNGKEMIYKVVDGIFKSLVQECKIKTNHERNYVLIIDEINRGNLSKIFGELITLIEDSKRIGHSEMTEIKLPYSGDYFAVPSNLYILGTMNTADRSIAVIDNALRRRFTFNEMMPNLEFLKGIEVKQISMYRLLKKINQRIEYLYDRNHMIGHAYFMCLESESQEINRFQQLKDIFQNKIIPLLQEYFYDDWEKLRLILGDNQKELKKYQFICIKTGYTLTNLFGNKTLDHLDVDDESLFYEVNEAAFSFPESYIKIYEE